jgi:hypothetical protein
MDTYDLQKALATVRQAISELPGSRLAPADKFRRYITLRYVDGHYPVMAKSIAGISTRDAQLDHLGTLVNNSLVHLLETMDLDEFRKAFVQIYREVLLIDPPDYPPKEPGRLDDAKPVRFDPLLTIPEVSGYEVLADRLEEETRTFRLQVANSLLPALKEELLLRKHATYDDKRELVKWVNAELRRFDLTIKHPKTGNASNFVAYTGNHPEVGRFQLRSEGEGGKVETFSTPKLSAVFEVLELIAAPQREEGLAKWGERIKDSPRPARGNR